MKRLGQKIWITLLVLFFTTSVSYAESYTERKVMKFNNPSKPGILKIVSGEGNISIEGYDGNEVIIETKSTMENVLNPPDKAKGMKRISGSGMTIYAEEENNTIVITRSMQSEVDLVIQVPYNTSIRCGGEKTGESVKNAGQSVTENGINIGMMVNSILASLNIPGGVFGGNITIGNITGDIEISTLEGNITLTNISGGVVANAIDGEMLITFKKITGDKPMAFSTIDGDIDVTLPSDIRATVTAKNVEGNTYTDFQMALTSGVNVIKDQKSSGFPNNLIGNFGNSVTGKINGGGTEILITTVDGDIFIRKGK